MSGVLRLGAVGLAVLCAVILGPVTASASDVVFIDRAAEADATFTSDANGVTTQLEVVTTSITGIDKSSPFEFDSSLVFVTLTNDASGLQTDSLSGFLAVGPSIAPDLQGASFGPTSVPLESNFGCCNPQPINLGVVWSASGAAQHDHMLNFFCPPGVCFGMFDIVGTSQPSTATIAVSGLVDGIDFGQLAFTQTAAVVQEGTGVGVFG